MNQRLRTTWLIVALFFGAMVHTGTADAKRSAEQVRVDGSSTVFPITEAVAEEFQAANRGVQIMIGISGTGGGFKKFCAGEIDIVNASRPIKSSEKEQCAAKKIDYIELAIAYDGLAVVVHPKNTWVNQLTVSDLKKIWEPGAQKTRTKWKQINPAWPDKEFHLFGPGVDSGTFDYFTEVVVGKSGSSRGDFSASEDDNVLVQGVSADPLALGFFGLAYYEENKERLKLVPIDDGNDANGKGPILPTYETVTNGTYQPMARPLFIYVSRAAAGHPAVSKFVEFYLAHAAALVKETGGIPLTNALYRTALGRFQKRIVGAPFATAPPGTRIEAVWK
jgi:phosphate transport system substrate-binding protein